MPFHWTGNRERKRMAIIASYFTGESYGLLGPQMAATVIQENTQYDCIVIGVARQDDKRILKKSLTDYFGEERPVIGFSNLSGREDLFSFAGELKSEGAITILAGPQADVDYLGEKDWQRHPHRFPGLSDNFSFSLHGPAEQAICLLKDLHAGRRQDNPGMFYLGKDGTITQNPETDWENKFLKKVKWDNLYRIEEGGFAPLKITTGQVLQHIGCPYATRDKCVKIDYPAFMNIRNKQEIKLTLKGCSFCDVAVDKGFHGALDMETVVDQIHCLPEMEEGRKIPFELINENPLPSLPQLLRIVRKKSIKLSKIKLTLRADWFLRGGEHLREVLSLAKKMNVCINLASIGFESFDDLILRNLNKGLTVKTNLKAVFLMRRLMDNFPQELEYSRKEGAIHGFIHPTPWDSEDTSANIQKTIDRYHLPVDILPQHSTPLIIHHSSGLADWIREIEKREMVKFKRYGSIIGWWQEAILHPSA